MRKTSYLSALPTIESRNHLMAGSPFLSPILNDWILLISMEINVRNRIQRLDAAFFLHRYFLQPRAAAVFPAGRKVE